MGGGRFLKGMRSEAGSTGDYLLCQQHFAVHITRKSMLQGREQREKTNTVTTSFTGERS